MYINLPVTSLNVQQIIQNLHLKVIQSILDECGMKRLYDKT